MWWWGGFYPVTCVDPDDISYDSWVPKKGCGKHEHGNPTDEVCPVIGLITCDKNSGCPAFFQNGDTRRDDEISGMIHFI